MKNTTTTTKDPDSVALSDIIERLQCAENDVAVAIIMANRIVDGGVMARRHDLHTAAKHIKASRFAAEDWLEFCERQRSFGRNADGLA